MRMHPEGLAGLIAVIVAPLDVEDVHGPQRKAAYLGAIDTRRSQVLRLAYSYYKLHDCDFDNSADVRGNRVIAGQQNLAKLNRANLR